VRFAFNPQHGGTLDLRAFNHVITCIETLGWFVELHFEGADVPDLEDWVKSISATVVIDHFGRIDARHGTEQRPFKILCELARRDNIWVKFSGADRISRSGPPYDDVVPWRIAWPRLHLTASCGVPIGRTPGSLTPRACRTMVG
jgi:predicted TIM-barrel fold metal-dependent hydrolase